MDQVITLPMLASGKRNQALIDPYRERYGEMFEEGPDEQAAAAEVSDSGLTTAPLKAIEK